MHTDITVERTVPAIPLQIRAVVMRRRISKRSDADARRLTFYLHYYSEFELPGRGHAIRLIEVPEDRLHERLRLV